MEWLVIEGVRPWDGRYEFDLEHRPLTNREWGWIKRHSGYLPLTIEDGWKGGDPELFAAFAVIALHRAGRIQTGDVADVYERFADTPFGTTFRLDLDAAEEGDAGPPAENSNANGSSSGDASKTSSGMWAPPDGTPASATSESAPARSAT